MSQSRDSDDFLGWAPDLGFWDAPLEPAANPPSRPPVVAAAPSPPPAPPRRSTPARPPARTAALGSTPPQRSGRRSASRSHVPVLVAFAITLVCTLFTALVMATSGPESSPVMLGVWGVLTAVLGRIAWVRAHR